MFFAHSKPVYIPKKISLWKADIFQHVSVLFGFILWFYISAWMNRLQKMEDQRKHWLAKADDRVSKYLVNPQCLIFGDTYMDSLFLTALVKQDFCYLGKSLEWFSPQFMAAFSWTRNQSGVDETVSSPVWKTFLQWTVVEMCEMYQRQRCFWCVFIVLAASVGNDVLLSRAQPPPHTPHPEDSCQAIFPIARLHSLWCETSHKSPPLSVSCSPCIASSVQSPHLHVIRWKHRLIECQNTKTAAGGALQTGMMQLKPVLFRRDPAALVICSQLVMDV